MAYLTTCIKRYFDGTEEIREYNNKGNLIHCKMCNGYEDWRDYDDKGNCIHFKYTTVTN